MSKLEIFELAKLIRGANLLVDCTNNNRNPTNEEKKFLKEYFELLDKIEGVKK